MGAATLIRPATFARPLVLVRLDGSASHALDPSRTLTFGSAPDVDVRIDDARVSRHHARIESRAGGMWVIDLDSTNGTYVDGVRVTEARLEPESRVSFGPVQWTVERRDVTQRLDVWPTHEFAGLLGRSAVMRRLFALLDTLARSHANVLIEGETGVGKEGIAASLHNLSPRRHAPFVVVDCGSLPENLVDAELFGHERGAFTGAQLSRVGALESADGGTVLLDEIGELPLAVQPKLLRVLESGTVRRLGESRHRPIDVRFLAATHRDLESMVRSGTFREDLYFRLAVVPVRVPPLRDRREDIELLALHFLSRLEGADPLDRHVFDAMRVHAWPGNVRELRNFIARAVAVGPDAALGLLTATRERAATLVETSELEQAGQDLAVSLHGIASKSATYEGFRRDWLDVGERAYLEALMLQHGGRVKDAAEACGVNRTYLHRLLKKHGLRGRA